MENFHYVQKKLWVEQIPVAKLAKRFGTPLYIYSKNTILKNYRAFNLKSNPPDLICYAVKANSNLAILKLLAGQKAGFDIVSRGELERVLRVKGDPKKIIFSGVDKQDHEIIRALVVGIYCFNV